MNMITNCFIIGFFFSVGFSTWLFIVFSFIFLFFVKTYNDTAQREYLEKSISGDRNDR